MSFWTSVEPETHDRLGVDVMSSFEGATFYETSPTCIYLKVSQLSVATQGCLLWPPLLNENKYDLHISAISIIISIDLHLNSMT